MRGLSTAQRTVMLSVAPVEMTEFLGMAKERDSRSSRVPSIAADKLWFVLLHVVPLPPYLKS